MKNPIITALRAGAAPLVLGIAIASAPAFAQDTAAQDATADEGTSEAIIVTGSRIVRPDLSQASPVAVVTSAELQLQATTNIENILNDMPQVTGQSTGASNNPGGGVATVDLRGLGTQRTLVLVDGRRYISYDVSQVVDLNTIPQALIERVDVVTGGRSAVYGSDAIAGVVNFVTKRDFEGIEMNSTYEISTRGDGARFNVNGTIGANFDDGRGNATVSVDYYKRKAVFAQARKWTRTSYNDLNNGTFAIGGSGSVPQGRLQIPGLNSALGFAGAAVDFAPDGTPSQYVSTTDAYNTNPVNYLQVPQERFLMSAQARYEVSSAFKPYIEGQFVNNRVSQQLAATPIGQTTPIGTGLTAGALGPIPLHVNSPYFTPALQTALRSLDTDGDGYVNAGNYGFRTLQLGGRVNSDDRNAFRIVAGAEGDIGAGWSYDGYYMYSRTKNSQRQLGNVALTSFLSSITTAFDNPATATIERSATPFAGVPGGGTLVCRDPVAGCVPANFFGQGNLSDAAVNYLSIGATNLEEYETQVASVAFTNGNLFDLGAGGVGVALGAEWRKESGSITPDTYLASGNVAGFNPGAPTSGSYDVTEFFAEVNVPLLEDNVIKKLEVNGAARYSMYSNSVDNVFTWAAGALAQVVDDFGFRGQYQRAIRGPSVNELYLGQTVSFDGQNDPCGNPGLSAAVVQRCIATGVPAALVGNPTVNDTDFVNPPTFQSGNPDLHEEKSTTWTIGAVITPTFLSGFSATIDYYNIEIDGYIGTYGQSNIFAGCFDQGIDSFCDLFTRNAQGQVDTIRDINQNAGGLETDGLDISVNYRVPVGTLFGEESRLSFNFAGTRVFNYEFTPITGLPITIECAGKFGNNCNSSIAQPLPKWRHSFRSTLEAGPATVSLQWRYVGKVRDDDPETVYAAETLKEQNYFDLTLGVDVDDNLTLVGAVQNMFDKKPPFAIGPQTGGNGEQSNTYPSFYDVLGRYFSVSARLRF